MKSFVLFALSSLAMIPAHGAILTTVTPLPTGNVLVGVPFEVEVAISGNTDEVTAFGFDFTLPSGLTLNSFTVDPAFLDFSGILGAEVVGLADPAPVATPTVALGRFNLTATAAGVFVLTIESDPAGNPDQGLFFLGLPTEAIQGAATVNATVIPEPSTLALGVAGALALAMARRRHSR